LSKKTVISFEKSEMFRITNGITRKYKYPPVNLTNCFRIINKFVKEELKIIKMDDNDKQIMRNVNILLCKTFLEIRFLWLK
jgi:hypothetical protein